MDWRGVLCKLFFSWQWAHCHQPPCSIMSRMCVRLCAHPHARCHAVNMSGTHFLACWNRGSTCVLASPHICPVRFLDAPFYTFLCLRRIFMYWLIFLCEHLSSGICVFAACVCRVFVSCLVFHKPSIFMIQLLHKPQIWFSVFLAEQLRKREEEERRSRRRKVEYRQIEGRRNRENWKRICTKDGKLGLKMCTVFMDLHCSMTWLRVSLMWFN